MSEENVVLEEKQEENIEQKTQMGEKAHVLCKKCGRELEEDQKFCPSCGAEYVEAMPTGPVHCKKCGRELEENQKFCPSCGAEYVEENRTTPVCCIKCGTVIPENSEFCPNCGNKKKAETKKKRNKLPILIAIGVAIVAAVAIVLYFALREIPVESVAVDKESVVIVEQDTMNISCIVYPDKATDKTVIWTSSDEKIAIVDQFGRITAVKKGECVITVKAGDKEAEIEVIVKKKLPDLKALYDEFCDSEWAELGSDHSYLSLDDNPDNEEDYYRLLFEVEEARDAIHKKLGLPDSLEDDMGKTTWSMGKQEEVFENIGIRVTWTYHPDKGLEVTYKLITEA